MYLKEARTILIPLSGTIYAFLFAGFNVPVKWYTVCPVFTLILIGFSFLRKKRKCYCAETSSRNCPEHSG